MAGAKTRHGAGLTVSFATTGFTARVVGSRLTGPTVEALDITHMESPMPSGELQEGGMEFMPDAFQNPGQLELDIQYDPDERLPVGVEDTITIQFRLIAGDAVRSSQSFKGFITGKPAEIPVKGIMTATVTIQRSGIITKVKAA